MKRRAIGADVSDQISSILVQSAIDGEACRALVPGYDVAAKTGTTTLYDGSNLTIASTAAYGPVNLPPDQRFVVLLVLHGPRGNSVASFGSYTAAPAVHDILQLLFSYYHRRPNQGPIVQPATRCGTPLAAN
jgi:cell division protein FtsI/penicillin-binding protein 2